MPQTDRLVKFSTKLPYKFNTGIAAIDCLYRVIKHARSLSQAVSLKIAAYVNSLETYKQHLIEQQPAS